MTQTPPTRATELSSLGRALLLSTIAAAVHGLLDGCSSAGRSGATPPFIIVLRQGFAGAT